jgi:hypothetical protein
LRQSTACALGVAMLVAVPGSTRASRPATPANALETDGVRLQGSWLEDPVRRAVHAAARRLAEPSCAAVLSDFRDHADRPLRDHLRELDLDASTYARMVLFYDGSNDSPCRRPRTYAFTAPGSRLVRTCANLGALESSAPAEAEAVVIHEILHTLGLEENPPTSEDITAQVVRRCRG